jgi:hypothetical protein
MKSKKIKAISCKVAAKYICESLDEKADSPLCREIKKHLAKCPDCSLKLISLKKIVTLYRAYPDAKLSTSHHKILIARLSTIK